MDGVTSRALSRCRIAPARLLCAAVRCHGEENRGSYLGHFGRRSAQEPVFSPPSGLQGFVAVRRSTTRQQISGSMQFEFARRGDHRQRSPFAGKAVRFFDGRTSYGLGIAN